MREPRLSELRAFCAAVDLGSLGRAATALHVSQPAVTKHMRALEAIAGARLLERSHRGVSPTLEGAQLYAVARRVVTDSEAIRELIDEIVADDGAHPPDERPRVLARSRCSGRSSSPDSRNSFTAPSYPGATMTIDRKER